MLFNSLAYAIFLPVVFFVYWAMPHRCRWVLLLVASYYFYMSWNPKYVVLILLTTIVSYSAGVLLEKTKNIQKRKMILTITLFVCLGILFVFKYFNFFSESVAAALSAFSIPLHPITLKLILPVGISFYTFQTLSYVLDVYRGRVQPEHHFGIYATFISFFPQLVAGPIERTENLLPQIRQEHRFEYNEAIYGLWLMTWGFFKKLAIADAMGQYVDTVYESLASCKGLDFVIAIFFFTIQIYCDFSGYSDIAIGTARLFGIHLMTNFKSPYFSKSVREFWSRWHISLSTWFRDYIYIPLGGNRCSKLKHIRNLAVTFLASGLWHGASWHFVTWGALHGAAQILETSRKRSRKKEANKVSGMLRDTICILFTFAFCNFAWVFFRAEYFGEAVQVLFGFFNALTSPRSLLHNTIGMSKLVLAELLGVTGILAIYDGLSIKMDVIDWILKRPVLIRFSLLFLLIFLTVGMMPSTGGTEFVYFQF